VSVRGGSTAFSATLAAINSTVTAVNDAPTIANGVIDDTMEDSTTHDGNLISDIFSATLTDVDGTAVAVAVINDSTSTQGQWQYSTDNGANWNPLGAVSESNALVLGTSAFLRFEPAADFHGAVPPIEVVGVDDTYPNAAVRLILLQWQK
jgi:hypothetical protein